MIHVDVAIDVQAYEVVLRFGNDATYRLGWAQAANFASLLNQASKEVEPDRARRILAKLGDRVRVVKKNPRPVYFETMRGEILGPAVVLHLATAPDGQGRTWAWRWIREDRLRPAPAQNARQPERRCNFTQRKD